MSVNGKIELVFPTNPINALEARITMRIEYYWVDEVSN